MKKLIFKFIPLLFFIGLAPGLVYAQQQQGGLVNTLSRVSEVFQALIPFLISLGVLYFIWGVVQYFIGDNEEAKKAGRDRILYGIIGLAVIVSIWGLVATLNKTLGLGSTSGLSIEGAPNLTRLVVEPSGSAISSRCPDINRSSKLPDYIDYVTCVIGRSIIPLLFALAVVMFIWGAIKFFIIDADEEAKRAQGKQFMIWGIVALTVMISVWGLVKILGVTFNIDTSALPQVKP